MKHYHNQTRGSGRGGVYYRAEDVKIFTDKDPRSKSINTLLNSPKAYSRDHHHHQPHSGRQGSIQSKPSSTAGSKQVPARSSPSTTAPGPSGGVVIYYSPATSAASQLTAENQVAREKDIDVPCPSSSESDLKPEQTGEKGAIFQSSVTNKIVSSASYTTSPSPSSSSSASTVIHQPTNCNQETKKVVVNPSMTNESISVTPPTRMTGFKKYEISV